MVPAEQAEQVVLVVAVGVFMLPRPTAQVEYVVHEALPVPAAYFPESQAVQMVLLFPVA